MISILYVLGCAAIFGAFIWATRVHFLQGTKTTATHLIYLFSVLTFASGSIGVFVTVSSGWQIGVGILISVIGAMLFFWTIHTTRERDFYLAQAKEDPTTLVSGGPYALVRHPFYLAYLLFWLGMYVTAPWWPTLVCLLALFCLYIYAARSEESKFEHTEFAKEYRQYRESVGFMMPRLRRIVRPLSAIHTR